MATNRCRWLILFAVIGSIVGLLRRQEQLALISIAVLVWIFFEWILFRIRLDFQFRHLYCKRTVNGSTDATGTMWAGRHVDVSVVIASRKRMRIPFMLFEDVLPENIECEDGDNLIEGTVSRDQPLRFTYVARTRAAGQIVLAGVSARISDLHGLFFASRFLSAPQVFRVLPTCVNVETGYPTVKRFNSLPPPGIHRLQRAGMGSELLELREYVPGDPPKSIAWKVSARRGKLMTRQYETDVPVRTVLFVDGSEGTRLGHFGHRPLDQLMFLAGTIARSSMAVRDPAGIELFDETGTRSIKSGLGERHFYRLLEELSDFSISGNDHALRDGQHATPLFRSVDMADLMVGQPVPSACGLSPSLIDLAWTACHKFWPELMDGRVNQPPFTWLPILPQSRSALRRRSVLATVISQVYSLSADSPIRLVHDDALMAQYIQRLLIDCGYAWTTPIVKRGLSDFHNSTAKFELLTEALTRIVSVGRDNELYVLLLNLLDHNGSLGRLAKAIRVARARHHRVVVISPLPSGCRLIGKDEEPPAFSNVAETVKWAERLRLTAAADRIKREVRRLGASIAFSADKSTLQLVLTQAELARGGRTAGAGRRR